MIGGRKAVEVMSCRCYHVEQKRRYGYDPIAGKYYGYDFDVGICWGTKECDECSCEGDESKCDFYPEKREKAKATESITTERERYNKIIAVDFDGTLCMSEFPKIGKPRMKVIKELLKEQKAGAKIILWTCREGDTLTEAIKWCYEQGIVFDSINESLPEEIGKWGTRPRKIAADEYWDDRAIRK